MSTQKPIPPLAAVQTYTRKYPDIWDTIDYLLDAVKDDPNTQWDRSVCLCPISAAYAACMQYGDNYFTMPAPSFVTALYTWKQEEFVCVFDEDLTEDLIDAAEDIVIPEIIEHLPAKCVYIRLPESLRQYIDGFFAFIEHDVNTHTKELRINPLTSDADSRAIYSLHLSPGATISQGMQESTDYARKQAERIKELYPEKATEIPPEVFDKEKEKSLKFIEFCVQTLLYICTHELSTEP